MAAGAPARLLAPLLALELAGRPGPGTWLAKTHLHMLTLLAQRGLQESRREGGGLYDFGRGLCWPHSDLLDADVSDGRDIVECRTVSPFLATRDYNTICRITDRGRLYLGRLRAGAEQSALGAMSRRIGEAGRDMQVAMLEEVYRMPHPEGDAPRIEGLARSGLAEALPRISLAFERSGGRHALFVAAMLERIEVAMSKARDLSGVRRRVVLGMSLGVVRGCAGLGSRLSPPVDAGLVDPRLADLDDLMYSLVLYCSKTGIMKDPMDRRIEEVFSKEEARRLCEALQNIPIRP